MRIPIALLAAALAGAVLAGCGEKPQRVVSQDEGAYNDASGESRLRGRTLNQGESGRISY